MTPTHTGTYTDFLSTGYSGQTNPQPKHGPYYTVPCPFCKCGKVMSWHVGHYDKPWVVECTNCQAQGPHADTEDEAFELWNKRRYGTIGE